MKIRVNYDLINKIKEAKTGIALKKVSKLVIEGAWRPFTFCVLFDLSLPNPLEEISKDIFLFGSLNIAILAATTFIVRKKQKEMSITELKQLASILRNHYINTDYELLQKAYEYETKYSFMLDEDKIPRIKQEKYIMVQVVDRDGEKEVSLVQEHLIGSKDYELSYGSPTKSKVLRPAFNC